jgi:hypothetical protein
LPASACSSTFGVGRSCACQKGRVKLTATVATAATEPSVATAVSGGTNNGNSYANGGNPTTGSTSGSKSLGGGEVAGIAIGTGLAVLGFCVLAFLVCGRRRSNPTPTPQRDSTGPSAPPPAYGSAVQAKVLPDVADGKGELGGRAIKNTPTAAVRTASWGRQPGEDAMLHSRTSWVPGQPYQGAMLGGTPVAELGTSLNPGAVEIANGSQGGYRYEMDGSAAIAQPGFVELPSPQQH